METNIITENIPKKALDKIEKALLDVVDIKDGRSRFQRAYDYFNNIKPNVKLVNTIIYIIKKFLNIPNITKVLLSAYKKASDFQFMIDADKMRPGEAGAELRSHISQFGLSSKLIDAIFGMVMLALKILQSRK